MHGVSALLSFEFPLSPFPRFPLPSSFSPHPSPLIILPSSFSSLPSFLSLTLFHPHPAPSTYLSEGDKIPNEARESKATVTTRM